MKLMRLIITCSLLFSFNSVCAKEPNVLVLIICSDNLPVYKGLQKVWRSYMHLDPSHFESYFIRGNPDLSSDYLIEEDVIWSKTQENITPGLLNKTLLSLESLSSRLDEFDYVLRCNLSSFFVFPVLLNFLKNAPKEHFYCGIHHGHGTPNHEAGWVCGAGILMSTDLAKALIAHKEELFNLSPHNPYNVDDVAIADFFAKNHVQITQGLWREIYSTQTWRDIRQKIPRNVFHFRIITPPPTRLEVDLGIHKELLKYFYKKTISFEDCY